MENNVKQEFFKAFKELKDSFFEGKIPEDELFKITQEFNEMTGGRLSHYNSPIPVTVAVVRTVKDGKRGLVGVKRGIPPCVGGLAFPGGYVNEGESFLEAGIRELREETGLYFVWDQHWKFIAEKKTPTNLILSFYLYDLEIPWNKVQDAFKFLLNKDETLSMEFIDMDTELCFPLHEEIKNNVLNEIKME